MTVQIQTITMTTGNVLSTQTFRFNPLNTILSYSAPSVATVARLQFSADNGTTWEPSVMFSQSLSTGSVGGAMFSLGEEFLPPEILFAPCLWRINGTVAANYTLKLITVA